MDPRHTGPKLETLDGRRIVLGVTGGIAAYKAIEVCRRLVDAGAHVIPVMTAGANRFVGATTFSALGSEPVRSSLFEDPDDPIPHTTLGQTADLVLVAPATARLLASYAIGYSHDLLTNILIATRAPVMVCPAMHTEMWEHPAVQQNLSVLRERGVYIVEPAEGRLAGGDIGKGRLAEPAEIVATATTLLASAQDMDGLKIVVSAGGTREPIDPVRFIGNRSSGKQGHAIAEQALRRGASVSLVTASSLTTSSAIRRTDVETAAQMRHAMLNAARDADIVVMSAAVADFSPATVADSKIKKADGVPTIQLVPTPDILAELGATKSAGQTVVGFAAETNDPVTNARRKLTDKHADLIVVNDVSVAGAGFEGDTNAVTIITRDGDAVDVPMADKNRIAAAVLDAAIRIHTSSGSPSN